MAVSRESFATLRRQAGVRQAEIADALGFARTWVSRVEHKKLNLDVEAASAWARLCGADLRLVEATHGEGLSLIAALTGDRLRLAIALLKLLPALDQGHVVTLWALAESWSRVGASGVEEAVGPRRVVK